MIPALVGAEKVQAVLSRQPRQRSCGAGFNVGDYRLSHSTEKESIPDARSGFSMKTSWSALRPFTGRLRTDSSRTEMDETSSLKRPPDAESPASKTFLSPANSGGIRLR